MYNTTRKNLQLKNHLFDKYFVWQAPQNAGQKKSFENQPFLKPSEAKLLIANQKRKSKNRNLIISIILFTALISLILMLLF